MTEPIPSRLEAAIKADLRPVRRLPSPLRRALWAAPLAAVTLLAASRVFDFREDATVLGWGLTWGASVLQTLAGLALVALALRHAIPGRSLRSSAVVMTMGAVMALSLVVTLRTWNVSPTTIGPFSPFIVGQICFTGTVVSALPLLIAAAILAGRAFSVRPWSSGALYGLGAGLGADAGWRLFCHFSDPAHVFPTHTGAILTVAVLGMLVSGLTFRLKDSAPST